MRVIVADDDPLARRLITSVLRDAGATVVAEARTGREALELALHYGPDVVVMDSVMPELDGILATRRLTGVRPGQLVVVLTGSGDDEEVAVAALQAGASGVLSKDIDVEALPRALAGVMAGEAAVSRRLTRHLVERLRRAPQGGPGMRPVRSPLTTREWEIVDLLRPGGGTDDIAEALFVSTETVRSHVKNIMRKLDVHSRAEVVAAADRHVSRRATCPSLSGLRTERTATITPSAISNVVTQTARPSVP